MIKHQETEIANKYSSTHNTSTLIKINNMSSTSICLVLFSYQSNKDKSYVMILYVVSTITTIAGTYCAPFREVIVFMYFMLFVYMKNTLCTQIN